MGSYPVRLALCIGSSQTWSQIVQNSNSDSIILKSHETSHILPFSSLTWKSYKMCYKVAFKVKWDDTHTNALIQHLAHNRCSKNIRFDYCFNFICGSGIQLLRRLWSHKISSHWDLQFISTACSQLGRRHPSVQYPEVFLLLLKPQKCSFKPDYSQDHWKTLIRETELSKWKDN